MIEPGVGQAMPQRGPARANVTPPRGPVIPRPGERFGYFAEVNFASVNQ